MKKTAVNLNKIPAWEIGKWYYIAKEEIAEWNMLNRIEEGISWPLDFSYRTATLEGKHMGNDFVRNVLEPWEAAILYPECKDTAPDGVDWSVPELVLPECLTKDEFKALEYGREVFYYSADNGTVRSLDNGVCFEDAYTEDCRVSGCFLTESEAQTFKELYEAGAIEFVDGTWRMKQSDRASELREVIQNLEAKNAELLHNCARLQSENADLVAKNTELLADNQSLEYASNILSNDCDSYEKENLDLRGVVESLTADCKSHKEMKDRILAKSKILHAELKVAKKIIAEYAIRLYSHEDI